MNTKIKPGYNSEREELWKVIPLETPYTVYISASHKCNLECSYCTYSSGKDLMQNNGHQFINTPLELVESLVEQLKLFDRKIKLVLFTGLGEPLMNPDLPKMIRLVSEAGIAENIEIYTNGLLLTEQVSKDLIEAGLTKLRVSIQGLDQEQYKTVTNRDIDFNGLVENIRYFFGRRNGCKVYIKTIDALLGPGDEEKFYGTFSGICDDMFVEHLVAAQNSMGDYDGKIDSRLTMYKEEAINKEVCPLPFYVLQMDSQGYVFPCTPLGLPKTFALGNLHAGTLEEMWTGQKLRMLRTLHLEKKRMLIDVCATCESFNCITHKTDNLDDYCDCLLKRINRQEG